MAKGRRKGKAKLVVPVTSHILCKYCNAHRDARGFNKHREACKRIYDIRHEARTTEDPQAHKRQRIENSTGVVGQEIPEPENLLILSEPMSVDSSNIFPESTEVLDQANDSQPLYGPSLPSAYIKIIPHPHSSNTTAVIIPLVGLQTGSAPSSHPRPMLIPKPPPQPWAPFATLADFEYTETAVAGLLSKHWVNKQLSGFNSSWAKGGSHLTLQTHDDMKKAILRARKYVVQFKHDRVSVPYQGKMYHFDFQYRDPWEYITSLVTDDSLSSVNMWNSVRKFLCEEGTEDQLFDEPNSGETWWNVDSSLPAPDPYPHCYIPLHFWLDKGLVTRRVKKHPMVLRPAWLPRNIRNASGNGGGVLLGYMPIIEDPADPSDRKTSETLEFVHFKRTVYHKVLYRIFKPLKPRSHHGETQQCGDGIVRVLYPGILIESHDGEEASYFCACRASLANFPCPKCLVPKGELHNMIKKFPPRTSESMRAIVEKASLASSKAAKEKILQSSGLHDIHHFLWDFRFSDPYTASSYDTLHSDDLGKWGHHLWVLLLEVLEESKQKGALTRNMKEFPRWNRLKHFNTVTTINYTDGQSYFDILKCILPCVVQLLPRHSPLVHCIRAYVCYRMMVGMHCMSDSRLRRLNEFVRQYQVWCTKVSEEHGKNYNFPKQHASGHVADEIRQKGTTDNFSTRPGEGFQQEAAEAYGQTNGKEAENQMVRIDETQEAIARIRMAVDESNKAHVMDIEGDSDARGDDATPSSSPQDGSHWKLGAPEKLLNSHQFEECMVAEGRGREFHSFNSRLRAFLTSAFPENAVSYEDLIQIRSFRCLYVQYQSLEDWTEAQDILRCNADFHKRERYDSVIINTNSQKLVVARLRALLRCTLPTGRVVDVGFVRLFRQHRWRPSTFWGGCKIFEEPADCEFILMDYVVRGALLSPVFDPRGKGIHYAIDTVDSDMFLRINGW